MTIGIVAQSSAYPATPYQPINWNELFNWDNYWSNLVHPIIFRNELATYPRRMIYVFLCAIEGTPKPEIDKDVSEIVRAIENAPKEDLCRVDPKSNATILHMAIAADCLPAIRALANRGINVNTPMILSHGIKIYIPPLMLAWASRRPTSIDTCRCLLELGARLEPEIAQDGYISLNLFQLIWDERQDKFAQYDLAFFELLVDHHEVNNNCIIEEFHVNTITNDRGIHHGYEEDKLSIFHLAVLTKHLPLIEKMILKGYDINTVTPMGFTALHFASMANVRGYERSTLHTFLTIRLLLGYGANVNTRNHYGETPLTLFFNKNIEIRKYDASYIQILDLFAEYGADANSISPSIIELWQQWINPDSPYSLIPERRTGTAEPLRELYHTQATLDARLKIVEILQQLLQKVDYYSKMTPSLTSRLVEALD